MRYLVHIFRSPRLILQLLLLGLAGLIGGAGLRGLVSAHLTLNTISSAQLPSLVHVLDAEREITQAENLGYRAVLDYDPSKRNVPVEIPDVVALIRQSWQNYRLFKQAEHYQADQAALQAQIDARFPGMLLAAATAEPLSRARVSARCSWGHARPWRTTRLASG